MNEKDVNDVNKELDEEALVDELFFRRESIDLTPDNAIFSVSEGGLIALELRVPDKEPEKFERVSIVRTFPLSNPDEFLSVREPDSREKGKGSEIGIIRHISLFDGHGRDIIETELAQRYFIPEITKIYSAKDKFGHSYWDIETTAGRINIIVSNPYSNIRTLEDGRMIIDDMEGNCFFIKSKEALDHASIKKIEVYF